MRRNCVYCFEINLEEHLYDGREGWRRPEEFSRFHFDLNLLGGERCYSRVDFRTVNKVLSQTFNHKICLEYERHIVCRIFNALKTFMQSFDSIETISHNKLCYIPGVEYCSSFGNSIFSVDKNNRDQTRDNNAFKFHSFC